MSEAAAKQVTFDVAKGLQFLHDNLVIHRDIKPDIILLENDRKHTARITDFSHAFKMTGRTKCEGIVGTLPYIAPEVLFEKPYD